MGQINTNNYPAVDSLLDADLLIVENATHGTGTTTPKQLRENAIGTDPLQTTAQTVTGAINEIFEMATDTVIGLELGKMTSFSDGVIVTDIDLHRAPVAGDRILFYHSTAVASPSSLTTYNDGVAVTKSIMDISMTHPTGLTLMKYGILGWQTVQDIAEGGYTAGTGISINGTTISNSAPQLGDDIAYSRVDTVTSGALGYFNADADCLVMDFRTDAEPYNGGYTLRLTTTGASFKYAVLKDKAGNNYAEEIPAGSLVMCKSNVSGTGSEADPVVVTVLEIGNTEMAHDVEVLKDICITEKTATGNPLTLTDALPYAALSLSADIVPIQDLHGYDKPWAGGAGKNKLDSSKRVANPDWCVFGGTLSNNVPNGDVSVKSGQWTISISEVVSTLQVYDASGTRLAADSNVNHLTFTSAANQNIKIAMNKTGGDWANYTYQLESGSTATSYAPYANICPISGHTSVTITRTDAESQTADFTISLGQTVYGADINWNTGVMTVKTAKTALTNISQLVGELQSSTYGNWIYLFVDPVNGYDETSVLVESDRMTGISYNDRVSSNYYDDNRCYAGNTGAANAIVIRSARSITFNSKSDFFDYFKNAEFKYKLATPLELTLTPTEVEMLKGYNQIRSDGGGDITLTYKADRLAAIEAALAAL